MQAIQSNGLSARAIPVDITVGIVANTAMAATMPAVPGWINVLEGYDMTGTGATAAQTIDVTTTGLLVNAAQRLAIPAGATVNAPNTAWSVRFPHGRRASAANTAVVVNVPAFGAGNTGAAINLHGYRVPA